jgi:hypothetical protein
MDIEVIMTAKEIMDEIGGYNERVAELMFKYSAILAGNVATRVTHVCLTGSQFSDMLSAIEEMEEMGKDLD